MDQSLEVTTRQTVKSHLVLVLAEWHLRADTCPHPVVGLQRTSLALLVLLMLLVLLVWVALPAVQLQLAVLPVLSVLDLLVELVVLALPVLGLFPREAAHSGLKAGLSEQPAHSVRSQDWWIRQAGPSSPSAPPYWNSQSPNETVDRMGKLVGILQVGLEDKVFNRVGKVKGRLVCG